MKLDFWRCKTFPLDRFFVVPRFSLKTGATVCRGRRIRYDEFVISTLESHDWSHPGLIYLTPDKEDSVNHWIRD
jgi:hypothetical protein